MVFDSMAKLVKYFWLVCLTTWSALVVVLTCKIGGLAL